VRDRLRDDHGASQKTLIVKDDVLVSAVVEGFAAEAGLDPIVAHDGNGALAVLDAEPEELCAVLTDIRMPGKVSGWDVARQGCELFPLLPVIYMTGDSAEQWRVNGVPGSMLQKPFTDFSLVTALVSALNEVDTRLAR
jgi:DNA-binding response OmpR family regulator